ncbi:glycosyltransferase involved in cell wall biosynthesis [Chitinophaga niastensis]|uniref:Glycosyltransferase involved in cell wall biosynthesis n=1 Tax=Chitinophaga niastensis TaxID=536980 RepID=A0A2P8HF95_CHINA|nr:glycosyltransferase [Chitinophaga niastensis]PSL44902.1 glycosyltransferase involved in cell wall biosynthesis [Chitinophaga niastensis]
MKNRKILFIINGLGYGGAESQLIGIMPAFADAGYEVSLVTVVRDLSLAGRLDSRIKHYNLGAGGIGSVVKVFRQLFSIVKDIAPDVIHSHLFKANLISRMIKLRFPAIRVINTTHSNYDLAATVYNPYLIYRLTSRWVDFHTAVSVPALENLSKRHCIGPDRSAIVHNAIDISKFTIVEEKPATDIFRWIAIGRLIEVKDYKNLFDALQLMQPHVADFVVDIAGDGDLKTTLKSQVELAGLSRHVNFLGIVKNIPALLTNYHGYVISSRSEGLPMAMLEAMSAGLPVTGTDVGEVKYIIEDAGGGIVVPPQDPAALAAGMRQMMNTEPAALALQGQRNAAFVRSHFEKSMILKKWEAIYENGYQEA